MLPLSILVQPSGLGSGSGSTDGAGVTLNPGSSNPDPNYVTFRKASPGVDTHGGPAPTYVSSVTLLATVALQGTPTRLPDNIGHSYELQTLAKQLVKVTLAVDPQIYLTGNLATGDLMDWAGSTFTVLNRPLPQGPNWQVIAEYVT